MDDTRFDAATCAFAARRLRRSISTTLAGSVMVGVLGMTNLSEAAAKMKHKKRKMKRRQVSPPQLPPSPPPPPPAATLRCDAFNADGTYRRFAQSFTAPLSGAPASAEVLVNSNPDGCALLFEVRPTEASGYLSSSVVFASGPVSNIPETVPADPPRRIAATFTTETAPLVAGQRYALSVTGSTDWSAYFFLNGNPCPDGRIFVDGDSVGPFIEGFASDVDIAFALTISG